MQERICSLLRGGAYRQDACHIVGIDYSTFARWMERGRNQESGKYKDFCNAILKAEALARMQPTHTIAQAAQDNPRWAAKWLTMRWPEKYSENRVESKEEASVIELKITGLPRPKEQEDH